MKKLFVLAILAVVMTVDVTAYTPHENGGHGICAMGHRSVEGRTVALNGVPLGSKVIYEGHTYTVEDRCGFNGVLDIFMEDYHKAIQFGKKKNVQIEVIY